MRYLSNRDKVLKSTFILFLFLILFISTVSFSDRDNLTDEKMLKLREIELSVQNMRGVVDLVSMRQHNVQKVIKIINRYNNDMSESQKYAIANEIHEMCMKYTNLNVDLICATITHESALTWRKDIVSPVGALGLMQIMPKTGETLAAEEGIPWTKPEDVLFDPIKNIRLGCRYLSALIQLYEIDGGLAAYNGGEHRAKLWLLRRNHKSDLSLLWEETRTYVPTILNLYAQFQTQTGIF